MVVNTSRTYRSALCDQQAERTRELIAAAARARFVEKGWAGTSTRPSERRTRKVAAEATAAPEGLLSLAHRGVASWHWSLGSARVYCVPVSLESFDTVTGQYGWSPADVESWWYTTLTEQFLA